MVVNLLKQYFPYMNKSISYYSKRVKNENNSEVENKIIFELSETLTIDEALEKLLSINPSLIEQFSVLKREYNLDGSKKNIDQIDSKIR